MTTRPPVLLADGSYYGTLAAARALGREGIRVTVSDPSRLSLAGWSRYVARRVPAPAPAEGGAFVSWLLDFGRREPGHVLLPTSDDTVLLYSAHRELLGRCFRLALPPHPAIVRLLDKWRLGRDAAAVGLDTPETHLPGDEPALLALAERLALPALLKPRTQALLRGHVKGQRVETAAELLSAWRAMAAQRYEEPAASMAEGIARPMVQAWHAAAGAGIHGVSGWIDRDGTAAFRGAVKILQRPVRIGTGVCFEHAEVDPALAAGVSDLCRTAGYHGPFEAEFLPVGERRLLIDFNPRFFGQMGFDVARGLPLPLLAYLDAVGEDGRRRELLEAAAAWRPRGAPVYRHRLSLELLLGGRWLSGRMAADEVRRWRAWIRAHAAEATDAASAPGDPLPGVADALREARDWIRHPRSTLRKLALDA